MGLQLGTIQLAAFEKRQGRWKESLAQLDGPLDGRPGCFPDPEYSASIQEDRIECRLHLGTAGEWVKDPVLVPLGGQRLPFCALIELDLALADRRGGGRALRSRAQEIGSILLKRCPLPREEIQRHIQRACEHFELLSLPREDLGRRIGEFAQNWYHLPELYEALQTDEGRLLPRWVEHARSLEQRDPDQLRSLLHVLAQSGRPEVGVLLEELEASGSPEFSALVLRVTHRLWRAANEDRRAVLGDV